jgi:hypothetical protein
VYSTHFRNVQERASISIALQLKQKQTSQLTGAIQFTAAQRATRLKA